MAKETVQMELTVRLELITNVPEAELDQTKADYESEGYFVCVGRQEGGKLAVAAVKQTTST